MADGLLGAAQQGWENLTGFLGSQNMGTLPAPGPKKRVPDKIQWTPKFDGDSNQFDPRKTWPNRDTQPDSYMLSPNPVPASENTANPGRTWERRYALYDDGNGRTSKVDLQTGKILWTRWSV